MKIKTILCAGVLAILPGLALAGGMCGSGLHDTSASSCGEGQIWDDAAQSCVDQVTG